MMIDDLAQEIRRVDGSHSLGAGALAEALSPWLAAHDARIEAHYLAKFAAERVMPDDVQALVEKARDAAAFWTEAPQRLLHQLADALEAAYSQKGANHE